MAKKLDEATLALQDALWLLLRDRGWGTIRWVEGQLKWPDNKLHKMRARGMTNREIGTVLAVLGVPARPFFVSVFGGPTLAQDRFLSQGAQLLATLDLDWPELAQPERPDVLTTVELDALDRARFDDPRAAIELARAMAISAATEGRGGDAAACIARMGSALRAAEQWHEAHAAVCWALNRAPEGPIVADAWRRAGSVISDYGDFEDAAELARLSMTAFSELGDFVGATRSLASRGFHLRHAGEEGSAIRCLRVALENLPNDSHTGRFAVHLALGLSWVTLGDISTAARHATTAGAIGAPLAGMTRLRWLRARIETSRGNFDQAAHLYVRTAEELEDSPADTALVGVELAQVYLKARRPGDAIETAKGCLSALEMPKRANRVVSAAIRDLGCLAIAGNLTIDVLEGIADRIRHAGERRAEVPRPRSTDLMRRDF